MSKGPRPRASRGFSLVELLIVIVIIAVLAAMLYAVAADALNYAATIRCRGQMQQIAAAVRMYATKFNDEIPPTRVDYNGATQQVFWLQLLVRTGCLSPDRLGEQNEGDPTASNSVMICPSALDLGVSYDQEIVWPDDTFAQGWYRMGVCETDDCVHGTYYWNGCTDREVEDFWQYPSLLVNDSDTSKKGYIHKMSEIKTLSTMVMLTDGVWFDGHNMPARVAARHAGDWGLRSRTNIAFYDGHVETIDRLPDEEWVDDPIQNRVRLMGGNPFFRLKDQRSTVFEEEEEEENGNGNSGG